MNAGTQREARGEFAHLQTIGDCVKQFLKDHGKEGTHDKVMPWVLKATNLRTAIERAVDGAMENGKKFHFGTCVRNSSKIEWTMMLVSRRKFIERCKDFEEVYDWGASLAPWGIGDFSKYVIAQRIGAYLKIEPKEFVYLHAGPRKGYKALFGKNPPSFRVSKEAFPKEMRKLKPSKIEDMLCEFRETFNRIEWRA